MAGETYRAARKRRKAELESARRARHAAVLAALAGGTIVRAAVMASEAGVSVRTVHRDVETLRARGYRILGEAGVGYQFRGRED